MNEKFQRLYGMAVKDLTENLLPWWMEYGVDEVNGGFYGQVDAFNHPIENATKFITLNARLIWTFASAYRILGDEKYLKMANRAYDYFMAHFYDKENGGFFTRVDCKGNPVDEHKFIYGNAFALYGLSEYARATGSEEALRIGDELIEKFEKYIWDPQWKGYYEAATKEWRVDPWIHGVNRLPTDVKTMNTHLHLIEAYTAHLRVRNDNFMHSKVREHLYVMLNRIVNHDIHHYHYFQDREWNPTSWAISYGHDIEGTWLMMETAQVLGEPEALRAARETCVNMARAVYEEGLTPEGAVMTEFDPMTGHRAPFLSWWEQNEGVVGFLNAWQMTGEEKFLDASLRCFTYAQEHFVDHENGGWFPILNLDGTVNQKRCLKVDGPICPYHNSRMSFEIIERYREAVANEQAHNA